MVILIYLKNFTVYDLMDVAKLWKMYTYTIEQNFMLCFLVFILVFMNSAQVSEMLLFQDKLHI